VALYPQSSDAPAALQTEGAANQAGRVVRIPLTRFLFGWRVAEGDYRGLAVSLIAFLLLMGILGMVAGYWYGFYRHSSGSFRMGLLDSGTRGARGEKATRNLPEA